jgi:hypothetical protein
MCKLLLTISKIVNTRERSRHNIVTTRNLSNNSSTMLAHKDDFVSAKFRNTDHYNIYCLTCLCVFLSPCGKMLKNSVLTCYG